MEKMIYIISNPAWDDWRKVGIASDWKKRWGNYQTSSPFRDFKFEWGTTTKHWKEVERDVHNRFQNNYEWVNADLDEVKLYIKLKIQYYEERQEVDKQASSGELSERESTDVRDDDRVEQGDSILIESSGHDISSNQTSTGLRSSTEWIKNCTGICRSIYPGDIRVNCDCESD